MTTKLKNLSFIVLVLLYASVVGLKGLAAAMCQTNSRLISENKEKPQRRSVWQDVPTWATSANDIGPVPSEAYLTLTVVLKPSALREAAFRAFLKQVQDPASPKYHQWLSPEEIQRQYGQLPRETQLISKWFQDRGIGVQQSNTGMFLNITATVERLSQTFNTSFHYYNSLHPSGKLSMAAATAPELPEELLPLISAITGLSSMEVTPAAYGRSRSQSSIDTHLDLTVSPTQHYITPANFTTLFNLGPLYRAGLTGGALRVAALGRSRLDNNDILAFEQMEGLVSSVPTVVIPPGSNDPGLSGNDDQLEATLDVERLVATAPASRVDLVVASEASGGVQVAAQYAVEHLRDPILTISFTICEDATAKAGVVFWDTLFAEAAAEGISAFAASGDSGAAGCTSAFQVPARPQVRSINALCASSYVTCVGGTQLADLGQPAQFWREVNQNDSASAIGYIPEVGWNEPDTEAVYHLPGTYIVASSGGGASLYVEKPSWQSAIGVPADGARDIPDISFPAAFHDGYFGCYAVGGGDCNAGRFEVFAGTSASAPSMAAIAALLVERTGQLQGNLNPLLYRLANTDGADVFHQTIIDIPAEQCTAAIVSTCNNTTPTASSLVGGTDGYLVHPGFNQVTGLGSVDVAALVNAASDTHPPPQQTSVIAFEAIPSLIVVGQPVSLVAILTDLHGSVYQTSTGSFEWFLNSTYVGQSHLNSGVGSITVQPSTSGANYLTATYAGDVGHAAISSSITIYVAEQAGVGFSLTSGTQSLSLPSGASAATASIIATPVAAFRGRITLACEIVTPTSSKWAPICDLTERTLTLNGLPQSTTLTVRRPAQPSAATAEMSLVFLFCTLCLRPASTRRRELWKAICFAVLIVYTSQLLSGCGKSFERSTSVSMNSFTVVVRAVSSDTPSIKSTTTITVIDNVVIGAVPGV